MGTDNEDKGSESPYAAVDAKLKAVVEALPTVPPWHDAWTRLGPDSTEEDRLAVYLDIRRAGSVPEAASFWLVSYVIDEIATRDDEDALGDHEGRMRAIEEAHGFSDGGVWPSGAAPAGYTELRKEYYQAWDTLFAKKLEEFGEHEMVRLFREDYERFEQLTEEGGEFFHEPDVAEHEPMAWLHQLMETVAGCMTADSPMGPLDYRYGDEEGCWEVDVYPTPVELIGGAVDGEVVMPGFTLDVEELQAAFDRVEALMWHSLGFPHDEGPRLVVEGAYQGREVFVQVLACAPEDEEPGMKLNTTPPKE